MKAIPRGAIRWINMISANAKKLSENEYISSDGVRRCRKCNEPTTWTGSAKIKEDGAIINCTFRRKCRCQKEQLAKASEEYLANQIQIAKIRAFKRFGLKYTKCDFTTDDRKNISLTEKVRSYINNFDKYYANGQGLILCGNVGVGKTYAAAIIINEILKKKNLKTDQLYKCYITKLETIKRSILNKNYSDDQVFGVLNNQDLLVIDDFGTQNDTNFVLELMQNIIDARYNNCKPIIITTNVDFNNIQKYADPKQRLAYERVRSRLCEMCKIIKCEGSDRRIYAQG